VSTEAGDPRSMLSLYRTLIRLRRASEALSSGDFKLLAATEHVLAYERRLGEERFIVALNMSGEAGALRLGEPAGELVLSTHLDDPDVLNDGVVQLRADEGLVFRGLSNLALSSKP